MECCARKAAVAQGSVAAAVGSGGGIGNDGTDNGHTRTVVGTSGSAGQKNRRTRRHRARVTGQARCRAEVESRAREGLKAGEGLEGIRME